MKKLVVCVVLLGIGACLYAYPLLSWGVRAGASVPFQEDPEAVVGVETIPEIGSLSGFVDIQYAFPAGLTFGLEGSIGASIDVARDNDILAKWSLAPSIGYTYLNGFFFQALFQPIVFTTNKGLGDSEIGFTTLDYKTGIQTYIGLVGFSIGFGGVGVKAVSLGLGAHAYWGRQNWHNGVLKNNSLLGNFSFSVSIKTTDLFGAPTTKE